MNIQRKQTKDLSDELQLLSTPIICLKLKSFYLLFLFYFFRFSFFFILIIFYFHILIFLMDFFIPDFDDEQSTTCIRTYIYIKENKNKAILGAKIVSFFFLNIFITFHATLLCVFTYINTNIFRCVSTLNNVCW